MPVGYVAIVLHGHLPFVRHPEHKDHLEERWLYEAINECYLPLIEAFERLAKDDVPFRVTFSMSPPLVAMLRDELLRDRFELHMQKLDRLIAKERERTENDPYFGPVVRFYEDRQERLWKTWRDCGRDIVGAFASLQERGFVEVWTCGATHAFFPALSHHPRIIDGQLALAVDSHTRAFGRAPRGIWLPECGYTPGVDAMLREHGIAYTAVETHAVLNATRRPRYGTAAPVVTPNGVACVARDLESSQQVWSKESGYPGDFYYREFYRDVGYDNPSDDVTEFVAADGTRQATGLKYFRITSPGLSDKAPYQPGAAKERAWNHALDFVLNRHAQIRWLAERMEVPPLILAPYDAELFGHWWFEGPDFLEALFRHIANSDEIAPITMGEYLALAPTHDIAEPEPSSWGAGGYASVWLDPVSGWMLRHVDHAARDIIDIVRDHGHAGGLRERAAKQCVRELMLLLSSDWAFLMKTGTAPHYARARFEAHLARFRRLCMMLNDGHIDEAWLAGLEDRDNLFAEVPLDWART